MYLVAGGSLGGDPESTEILVSGSTAWSLVGNLPGFGLFDLRGVSLNNKVIMTGIHILGELYSNHIPTISCRWTVEHCTEVHSLLQYCH